MDMFQTKQSTFRLIKLGALSVSVSNQTISLYINRNRGTQPVYLH